MECVRHVAQPPARPLAIYDGDCGFCKFWIHRWQRSAGDAAEYLAFQDPQVAQHFPELSREQLATALHFIETDGAVYQGAEAVFRLRAVNPSKQRALRLYQRSPLVAEITESAYRFVADHRPFFSWLTRVFWGGTPDAPKK